MSIRHYLRGAELGYEVPVPASAVSEGFEGERYVCPVRFDEHVKNKSGTALEDERRKSS
ncbi:MAG: hypothetical protein KKB21_02300 [Nanoarchaeota archaeon]|nr:hypothetical protein [Nanoarchaeota archaeon]MBU4086387.1 hypothetical protein [Nanoarchaeota archaeon]